MRILLILLLGLSSISCATVASQWTAPRAVKYTDAKGLEQVKIVDVQYLSIKGNGDVDFKNETLDGKTELIPKELVSISGSKITND